MHLTHEISGSNEVTFIKVPSEREKLLLAYQIQILNKIHILVLSLVEKQRYQ